MAKKQSSAAAEGSAVEEPAEVTPADCSFCEVVANRVCEVHVAPGTDPLAAAAAATGQEWSQLFCFAKSGDRLHANINGKIIEPSHDVQKGHVPFLAIC